MKIAFCCGSLEPGRDGVGDYTRRLAGELIRRNHACVAIALNDPYVSRGTVEEQIMGEVSLPVLRLCDRTPWEQRLVEARKWLRGHNPDWMSLQFVPFGFHPKGLCVGLGKFLAALGAGAPWQVMFHELWLGLGQHSSIKARIWGGWQRGIVLDCLRRLGPKVVHTQAEPYRLALEQLEIKASILPLFSNIPLAAGDGWAGLLEPLVADAAGGRQERGALCLAGILGAVHSEWNAAYAVDTVLPLAQQFQKRLVLVFHGKNNLPTEAIQRLKAELRDRALVVATGERSSREISQILQTLDLGLATTPLQAIQKSGSTVAMLEHGLPVLVIRDDWHLRGGTPLPVIDPRILTPTEFATLKALPKRQPVPEADHGVKRVADQMLASLASAMAPLPPVRLDSMAPLANRGS